MKKIGICFPQSDFLNMKLEDFKEYVLIFKKRGLYSFDMYTSFVIGDYKNINEILKFLNENDIKVTFHYDNVYNGPLNESNIHVISDQYKKDLISLRNKLEACGIFYQTTVVFHPIDYEEEYQKYEHLLHQIEIFNNICLASLKLKFDISAEILAYNHPFGNHIGDDYDEMEKILSDIKYDNFGVCWDIGHTRLNSLEEYSNIFPPTAILKRVKFTHIHSFSVDDGEHEVMDHLPLINELYRDKEIKYLLNNNYDGIYSIETSVENLKENIDIYLNSIDILNDMLGGK